MMKSLYRKNSLQLNLDQSKKPLKPQQSGSYLNTNGYISIVNTKYKPGYSSLNSANIYQLRK